MNIIFKNPTAEFHYKALTAADIEKYLNSDSKNSKSKKIKAVAEITEKWKLTTNALTTIKAILPDLDSAYWQRKSITQNK